LALKLVKVPLDQLVVEGFSTKAIKKILAKQGTNFENQWGSLRLLQEYVVSKGLSENDAISLLAPLKQLHEMRSKVKGHGAQSAKQSIIDTARTSHGSLALHFRVLAGECAESFFELTKRL
jgi:hypothetical protein